MANTAPGVEGPRVVVGYLSLMARLLLQSPNLFRACLASPAAATVGPPAALWGMLVEQWVSKFDDIGGGATAPWVRKSWVMALCVPISSGEPVAVSNFFDIVNLCVQVLADETTEMFAPSPERGKAGAAAGRAAAGGAGAGMAGGAGAGVMGGRVSLEAAAKHAMQAADPVHAKGLRAHVKAAFDRCAAALGQQGFAAAVATVDPTVVGQLQTILGAP